MVQRADRGLQHQGVHERSYPGTQKQSEQHVNRYILAAAAMGYGVLFGSCTMSTGQDARRRIDG